tara:strand:- start:180 stop:605 length:426 start_codon:yes stop_codon:yes gene_type:complete
MKIKQHIFFISLIGTSFLFSDYTKAPKKHFSFQKTKKDGVIKSDQNDNLKTELLDLESRFKSEYDMIKNNYKEQITSLKGMQKSEVQSLKQNYKERRRAIYQKYGVKPPKKNDENSMMNSNVFKPKTGKKDKKLPIIKSKK